jgi:hypothetical protein
LFPLSSDPLDRIPPSRLVSWPLTRQHRFALRLASLGLSPILWLTVGIMLLASPTVAVAFLLLAVAIQGLIVLVGGVGTRAPAWNPLKHIPQTPGNLGAMIRNHTREMLSTLDPYLAAVFSAAGIAYRLCNAHPDPSAFPILAMLVALAMSTSAQCLFGLDSLSAMTRNKLLPLRGWQILLAKDIAFLALLLILVAPLAAGPGMTFGLIALAIGHFPSVARHSPQRRWRFASGRIVFGVAQMVFGAMLGLAESERSIWFLVGTAAAWIASLYQCGRKFDAKI